MLFHSTHKITWSGAQLCWPSKFVPSKRNTELRPHGVKVKAPMIWVFPCETTTCRCPTSSEQEDAEALFTSQLRPLSFTSKPPTRPQSRGEQIPVCFLLLRDLLENLIYWLYWGLAAPSTVKEFQLALQLLWLHVTVVGPGFNTCRVIFPPQFCPLQNNITFSDR